MRVYAVHLSWSTLVSIDLGLLSRSLSDDRRRRIDRYLRTEDKYRSAMAGRLKRHMLFVARGVRGGAPLVHDRYGRPRFSDVPDFDFNLSHSGNWVVGVADTHPVGIDIEAIDEGKPIIDRVLSRQEIADLSELPPPDRPRRFTTLWTLKEAHAKAVGQGLHLPFAQLSFSPRHSNLWTRVNRMTDEPLDVDWHYRLYSIDSAYSLAVCATHTRFPANVQIYDGVSFAREVIASDTIAPGR